MCWSLSVPIVIPWMLKDVDISFKDFFLNIIGRTQLPLIIGSLFFFITLDWINNIDTWFVLVFVSFSMLVYLFAIGYIFVLNKNEKYFLKNIFLKLIN